ncbi:NAD(P)-dependent oxidoreductase [Mycolicibacterium goodii]|uniref:NAD(P)-dependent oxidoreductase n=1 Tax=Mycolicibacterium goodii TaxID=134601 RepID=UPI001F035CCF|nr:NAD(P)-dependent oxidoreductase [Mycolicibacterium goodii]ULN47170.1 NAD(P)-dependent oxidoreductase [Mycolicibacterium goodii]
MSTASTPSAPGIGFIGLGNMGGRMTACMVRAGRQVLGFDTRHGAAEEVGATPAPSAASVVENSDIVLLSLPDSTVVEAVVYSDPAFLEAIRPHQVIVDLSTSAPASTQRIAADVAARGASFLDAGISGGAAAAEKGTLTLMVGGDASVLESVRPVLEMFADKIFRCGGSGAGHTVKLLNNFLNAVTLSATAEVMVAAKKADLDLKTVLDVINSSSGVSFASLNRFPKIIEGDYLKGGLTNTLMLKDVTLYLDLVAQLGVASLNAPGPVAAFGLARQLGYADRISNTVVDAIGDVSGGVRLYDQLGEVS